MADLVLALVATEDRAVMIGRVDILSLESMPRVLEMHDTRQVLLWDAKEGGLFGLAESGPSNGCRLGAVARTIRVVGPKLSIPLTADAAARVAAHPVFRG